VISHPGIVLAIVATIIYNLGFILEKRALGRLPAIEAHQLARLARTLFTAPAWLAGFVLICCGLVLQVLVLSLEPLTVAQPLQATGVVVTILFSRLMLHERLGRAEFTCIGVIAVAAVLLGLSSGRGSGTGAGTHAAGAAIAVAALPACLLVPVIYYRAQRAASREHRYRASGVSYGCCAGLIYGFAGVALKASLPRRAARRRRRVAVPVRDAGVLRDRHVPVPGGAPAQPGLHRHADFPDHQHRIPGRQRLVAVPRAAAGQPGAASHAAGRRYRRRCHPGHPDRHLWKFPKGGAACPARPADPARAPRA
jgi:Magnesium transporter NIPA